MTANDSEHTFGVAELGRLVQDVLAATFPTDVWIRGEVRSISRPRSGHVYFDLVDPSPDAGASPEGKLSVVLFKGTKEVVNAQIRRNGGGVRIDDGVELRIRGALDFHPPQGRIQLRMTGIDPEYTIGLLGAARDRLLRRLHDEGILDANRGVPLPLMPLHIGLVTAPGSAAHADFVDELVRSRLAFRVVVAATPVQGVGAAARIAAAIGRCVGAGVDLVAVVRGGGARTDLAVFDDELVARAIAGCPVPVLTGIGHEIDQSVADLVAHDPRKTPTACAAAIVERVLDVERHTEGLWGAVAATARERLAEHDRRLTDTAATIRDRTRAALREAEHRTTSDARRTRALALTRLDRAGHRLERAAQATSLSARHRIRLAETAVDGAAARLPRAAAAAIADATTAVDTFATRARLLDPARALARGWSITTDHRGAVVRSVDDVAPGTILVTRVADGSITSTVADAGTDGGRVPSGDVPGDRREDDRGDDA